jgi:asparagine synthase (glutamine-hydrolysing)
VCGIFGMATLDGSSLRHTSASARVAARLRHRGPDGHGERARPHVLFGAERLRIQDLSPRADQPLADPGDRIWLVCNGEIYNAAELRRRFPAYAFVSDSDVEVAVPLYLAGGPGALANLSGMFALALWDESSRTLVLARDRAGEKPLFRATGGGELWFASEVAALMEHPDIPRQLDHEALREYLALGFTRAPRTLLAGIESVEPGCIEVHRCAGAEKIRYWDPAAIAEVRRPVAAAIEETRAHVERAVARQVRADVPIGVFASGGVDSSLIAAVAARHYPAPLHLFTAAFVAPTYDETPHAAAVARSLGARHTVVRVDDAALRDAYDLLTDRVAEPIADPAALPTFALARRAKEHVGVVLSGEGADELFGGYPAYLGHVMAPRFARLPGPARQMVRQVTNHLPPSSDKVPLTWLIRTFVASADLPWRERHAAWTGTDLPPQVLACAPGSSERSPSDPVTFAPLRAAMLTDYAGYLTCRLLPKLDRATMLVALEARAPYLDTDLSAFALSLPADVKVRGLTTKWLLKRIAETTLPPSLVRRRKRGLSVPIAAWLNGDMRGEVDRLLAPDRLRQQGLLSDVYVGRLVAEHRTGRANHARALWTLLVLERWLERWGPEVAR